MTKIKKISDKALKIIVTVAVACALGVAVAGGAYAIWAPKTDAAMNIEIGVDNENPSLKYQIFLPLDSSGAVIDGTFSLVEGKKGYAGANYVLAGGLDVALVASLALVGWENGVTVTQLMVPETFKYTINGGEKTLPVTAIIADARYREFYFRNNRTITAINLPKTVTMVADGVFSFMSELREVNIAGATTDVPIHIAKNAFVGCDKLESITAPGGREIAEAN